MDTESVLTEADILNDVVAPDSPTLGTDAARSLLDLGFSRSAQARIRRLLQANNRSTISATERSELEKYLRVGQLLDLLQAKARASLVPKN